MLTRADQIRAELGVPTFHLACVSRSRSIETASSAHPDPNALIRWASVGKLHTALLVLRLAQDGHFDLDAPVTSWTNLDWLHPHLDMPQRWYDTVSLGHLLGHTSGLRDVLGDPRFTDLATARQPTPWTPWELLDLSAEFGPPLGLPGHQFSYSDTGYVVAALALEHHLGRAFHLLLREHLLVPAGLHSTFVEADQTLPARPAAHWTGGLEEDLTNLDLSFDWAGGGITATTADTAHLLHHALTGPLLNVEARERLTRWDTHPHFAPEDTAHYDAYGLGLGLLDLSRGPVWAVTGAWGTFVAHDPSTGTTVAGATAIAGTDTHRAISLTLAALDVPNDEPDVRVPDLAYRTDGEAS